MTLREVVKYLQRYMNKLGENLTVDGQFGPVTAAAFEKYDITLTKKVVIPEPPKPAGKNPPWYDEAKKFQGKKETDPAFNKEMSKKWSLFGMNLGTISQSWAAWCGLAMAVALSGVGVDYAKNGALARNWAKYGVEINWKQDGIPKGSIIHINHSGDCKSSSSNHVAQAEGDCTVADLTSPGAYIDLYGGNQGNTWKVSTFPVKEICAVRWPKDVKDYPKPGPVTKSEKCSSKKPSGDSTR